MKRCVAVVVALLLAGCVTARKSTEPTAENLQGMASWYGQEFAGRTTANGEIFDPMQFTAAHRTLPFGTVVDVRNTKNGQSVRVRINDRGPYINDRVIDLSYVAAQKIGLIEPGTGPVELSVVKWGKGDREPPAPYVVSVADVKPIPDRPAQPAPQTSTETQPAMTPAATIPDIPVVVDTVNVVEEHAGVETRRQVSPDGKRIETVPVEPGPAARAPQARAVKPPVSRPAKARIEGQYLVQVGAFALEANAKLLQDQLSQLGEKAYIDHAQLFHVRIGPFVTRDEAVRMRTRLETAGLSAIVIRQ